MGQTQFMVELDIYSFITRNHKSDLSDTDPARSCSSSNFSSLMALWKKIQGDDLEKAWHLMLLVNCIWLHITYSEWMKNTYYAVEIIFYSFHYKWLSDCPVLGKRLVYLGNMKTVWSKVLCYSPWLCAVLCFQSQWENNLGFNSTGLDSCHDLHWVAEPPSELHSFLPLLISQWALPSSSAMQISVDSGRRCHEMSNVQSTIDNTLSWKGDFGNSPDPSHLSQMASIFHLSQSDLPLTNVDYVAGVERWYFALCYSRIPCTAPENWRGFAPAQGMLVSLYQDLSWFAEKESTHISRCHLTGEQQFYVTEKLVHILP